MNGSGSRSDASAAAGVSLGIAQLPLITASVFLCQHSIKKKLRLEQFLIQNDFSGGTLVGLFNLKILIGIVFILYV